MKGRLLIIVVGFTIFLMAVFLGFRSYIEHTKSPNNFNPNSTTTMKILRLTSSVFKEGDHIPLKYTCEGDNVNPPLDISGVDPLAVSLVLILEDPDVPKELRADGMFDHWVRFNIPPTTVYIREGTDPEGAAGLTTAGGLSYIGPCPPSGEHRYFFKLFSLDTMLDLASEETGKKELEAAMEGHVMQSAELIGLYKKQNE